MIPTMANTWNTQAKQACSTSVDSMAPGADTMAPSSEEQQAESAKKEIGGKTAGKRMSPGYERLLIVMCGPPGRGKSHVAHCLARRLNWDGHPTKVMRVSEYNRKRVAAYAEALPDELIRPAHMAKSELKALARVDAARDCVEWLHAGNSVAIMDDTLETQGMRAEVYKRLSIRGFATLFIECSLNDQLILERNYQDILQWDPEYVGMDPALAKKELMLKLEYFNQVYQPMIEYCRPSIRLDTATMDMETFAVTGYLARCVVGYLGSICIEPHTLFFTRHGESEYNVLGKVGGNSGLTARGKRYAQALASTFKELNIPDLRVMTSRLQRTALTARGLDVPQCHLNALNELNAGVYEGLTYKEMQERYPQEFSWRDRDKLRYRYPGGESYADVMRRVMPVIEELQQSSNVLVVSHQAVLRCILGYFMDKKPEEVPDLEVPLHVIVRIYNEGFKYKLDFRKVDVD